MTRLEKGIQDFCNFQLNLYQAAQENGQEVMHDFSEIAMNREVTLQNQVTLKWMQDKGDTNEQMMK